MSRDDTSPMAFNHTPTTTPSKPEDLALAARFVARMCPDDAALMLEALGMTA